MLHQPRIHSKTTKAVIGLSLSYFNAIPDENVIQILLALNPNPFTLGSISRVSKRFQAIASLDIFWKRFLKPEIIIPADTSAKQIFRDNIHAIKDEYYRFSSLALKKARMGAEEGKSNYSEMVMVAANAQNSQKSCLFRSQRNNKPNNQHAFIDIFPFLNPVLETLALRAKSTANAMFRHICGEKVLSTTLLKIIENHGAKAAILTQPECLHQIMEFIDPSKLHISGWQLEALADVLSNPLLVEHANLAPLLCEVFSYLRDPTNAQSIIDCSVCISDLYDEEFLIKACLPQLFAGESRQENSGKLT